MLGLINVHVIIHSSADNVRFVFAADSL